MEIIKANEEIRRPGGALPLYEDAHTARMRDSRALLLAGTALFIFGAFLGCLVYRLLGLGESELYDKLIERYFLALFYRCVNSLDVLLVIADCLAHELALFILVYLGGFTLFTGFISGAAIAYRGLLFGFALTMLQFSTRTGLLLDSICYLASSGAVSLLLIIQSAASFSFYYPERTPRLFGVRARRYTLLFLQICGLVFANVCAMLFLIYIYL